MCLDIIKYSLDWLYRAFGILSPQALYHIHRAIGSKVVGFEKNTLLHFDAHPDLLWPHDLTSDDLNSPNTVTEFVNMIICTTNGIFLEGRLLSVIF